jgi:hypothetical protein
MLLPAEILTNVSTQLSISFWYLMPPALEAYNYLGYNTARDVSIGYDDRVFEMPGFKVYSLESWGYGHMMTADGLGTTRLFGMYGPAQPIDRWNHFVFTIDGKEARIYINGKQAYDPSFGTKTLAELKVPGQPLCVMSNVWACMDELRLYNYVLPQSEIDGLYRSDGQGELARYSFDNEAIGAVSAVHDDAGYEASAVGAQVVGESNGASFLLGPGGGLTMPAALTFGKDCSAFTYATWVKRPVGQSARFTLMKAAADARYSMEVGFWNNALWGSAAQSPIVGSFPNDGGWHHLIVSYGNSRLRAYVDGVKVQDNPQAYMDPYYGFGVGTLTLTNATTVGIGVDDMRFFNFALSDEQALQVYLGTDAELIPEPPAGLDQPRRVLSSGFLAEFFDFGDTNLTTVPDLTLRAADETRTVGQISYPGSSGAFLDLDSRFDDYFADRHSGSLSIPVAGDYTFAVESDDGFRLLIDGQLVALSDVSGRQQTAPLSLSAGLHPFVLLHYENTGVAGLRLLWSGPGIDGEELIPASALYKADYIDALTPMQRWRLRSWGVIDAGGLFAPDADYNGDGVKNLMAYAMGASPMGPVPLPEGSFENGRMRMAFNRVRDHTDIIYEVAASDNMIDWATIWSSETVPYGNPAAESERVIVEDVSPPHEANRRFMELRVIRLWQ